jgi:RimJ/RimL family protein N-acetyltransferase
VLLTPNSTLPDIAGYVGIRRVQDRDLRTIAQHGSRRDLVETTLAFQQYGFWGPDNGAVSIVDAHTDRLVGTAQYFRPGPTVRGFELAYAIYDVSDRNRGYVSASLRMFSDLLYEERPSEERHQLIIGVTNIASCIVAERGGFSREGCLRGADVDHGGDSYLYGRLRDDWLNGLLL